MKRILLVSGSPLFESASHLQSLAQKHDVVIACDLGADYCMQAGIAIDVFIGDQDSVSDAGKAYANASASEIREYAADKDATDFELALQYINETYDTTDVFITITNVFGNRIDHMLAAYGGLLKYTHFDMVISEASFEAWILDAKQTNSLYLHDVAGQTFSLLSFSKESKVSLKGFKWNLKHETLEKLSGKGVSNVVKKKRAQVYIAKGKCLAILYGV